MNNALDFAATAAWPLLPANAAPLAGIVLPVSGVPQFDVLSALGDASGLAAISRNQIPWSRIADWTHQLPKTATDHWLDVVDGAVRGPRHRWLRHHPVDFATAWLNQGSTGPLRVDDYLRHLSLDAITVNGIPMLPEGVQRSLESLQLPGLTRSAIHAWTHLNLFDLTVGSFSTASGGYDLFLALSGNLPWEGTQTLLLTCGVGSAEVALGVALENPLLVAGGMTKIASGAVSAWQHFYSSSDQLISQVVPSLLAGAGGGATAAAVRMALQWRSTTPVQKAGIVAEGLSVGSLLALLSGYSLWASTPLGASIGLGKVAFSFAQAENKYWSRLPLTSRFADQLARRNHRTTRWSSCRACL